MNTYATLEDILEAVPNKFKSDEIDYQNLFQRTAERCSRIVDQHCRRLFYPTAATRYFDGDGTNKLWIPDLISVTSISYSENDGETYTALAGTDYYLTAAGNFNDTRSYTLILLSVNGDLNLFPIGQRSIKIIGIWGYTDDISQAFENSQDTTEDNPLSSGATSVLVNDSDGLDLLGVSPRLQVGQLLRIESEYLEVRSISHSKNILTVVRGRNGSTAASHVQNTAIEIWRPPAPIREAVKIMVLELVERNFYDFNEKSFDLKPSERRGQRGINSESRLLLSPYVKAAVG